MNLKGAFQNHIQIRQADAEKIAEEFALPGLVYSAGGLSYYFQDDRAYTYRPFHHFAHWVPCEGHDHVLVVRPGQKPLLLYFRPEDYWHEHETLSDEFWIDSFDVQMFGSVDQLWDAVGNFRGFAHLGPEIIRAEKAGLKETNPQVLSALDWCRGYKSEYEIMSLDQATECAARGHIAAYNSFMAGGSELDIHLAYLAAARQTEADLPYNAIVGLNEKAAILHYEHKRDHVRNGDVLLIDSGARIRGYGSDITRTYTARRAPQEFVDLLKALNEAQMRLCGSVAAGMNFGEIHHRSHLELAKILLDSGLVMECSSEDMIKIGITRLFYPHGIGHMLGIFVHDVGGKQIDRQGTMAKDDEKHPTLRTLRKVEPGFVFTVEPGLYFIDFLLKPWREGEHRGKINWSLVDRLLPFGGIRIEDNIVVTRDGIKNLTRPYLP